jgi:hypothetical protein
LLLDPGILPIWFFSNSDFFSCCHWATTELAWRTSSQNQLCWAQAQSLQDGWNLRQPTDLKINMCHWLIAKGDHSHQFCEIKLNTINPNFHSKNRISKCPFSLALHLRRKWSLKMLSWKLQNGKLQMNWENLYRTWILSWKLQKLLKEKDVQLMGSGREQFFIGLAYQEKDIVFRFILEYSSLMDFWPLGNNNRSIFIWGLLKDDILACVETWD